MTLIQILVTVESILKMCLVNFKGGEVTGHS